jgi:hypothetical protein
MSVIFQNTSDNFYKEFFEPDLDKRRNSIEDWIKLAVPVMQSAIEAELRSYLNEILEATWSKEGWESRVKKFARMINDKRFLELYCFTLDLEIKRNPALLGDKTVRVVDLTSLQDHGETLRLADYVLGQIETAEEKALYKQQKVQQEAPAKNKMHNGSDHTDDSEYDDNSNHTSEDDRSDSMNPNNDAYHASMDNRSDQMNPNNDAFWSSRGR